MLYVAFVLVCGYLYTYLHLPAHYKQRRSSGWESYFSVATIGFVFVLLASFLTVFLDLIDLPSILLSKLENGWGVKQVASKVNDYFQGAMTIYEVIIAALALSLSALWGMREHIELKDPDRRKDRLLELCVGNDLETLLLKASSPSLPLVMVTLGTRRCYVGMIPEAHVDKTKLEYIGLIPIYSGYRNEEALELSLTISYERHYEEAGFYSEDADLSALDNFKVVIPISSVVSASFFSEDAFDLLSESNISRKLMKKDDTLGRFTI